MFELSDALLDISTIDQSASWDTIRELIPKVLQSAANHQHLLPILICYLRNHRKYVDTKNSVIENLVVYI